MRHNLSQGRIDMAAIESLKDGRGSTLSIDKKPGKSSSNLGSCEKYLSCSELFS